MTEPLPVEQDERGTFASRWLSLQLPLHWLAGYRVTWLAPDFFAGITLAAYAIPVSLAYATLAGLPPQVGIYGYMLGGLGYAVLGSSRQLAIGPTSAIALMIAGTVGAMAGGDALRYGQIASLAALTVGVLCLLAWLLRLSNLVKLISDSILVGFKAGAGLVIAVTQLPSLLGVPGGGHSFAERIWLLAGQVVTVQPLALAVGAVAIALILAGERLLPNRPVALAVVVASIAVATWLQLPALGLAITGVIPSGLPSFDFPELRLRDVEGIVPLALGCLLLAYIEGISAARTFAARHRYPLDARQELLGLGAANIAAAVAHGFPVAGGLSQSAVNDKAGARTPMALVVASGTLALCVVFLTGFLENLPKAVLAGVVLTAVRGLMDVPALVRLWRLSRADFAAAVIALAGVLLLGILQGILLAALASVLILLTRAASPHIAVLGRIPGTTIWTDMARHPDNQPQPGVVVFRPEGALLYVNAESILETMLGRLQPFPAASLRLVVCDLSAAPIVDLAGAEMLGRLHEQLAAQDVALRVVGALASVRDLLRATGLADRLGGLERGLTIETVVTGASAPT